MAQDDGSYLITPPPGLFPNAPQAAPAPPATGVTDSGTHRFMRPDPVQVTAPPPNFIPTPGTPPPTAPPRLDRLTIEFVDGTRHVIGGKALLGRDPVPQDEWVNATTINVPDPEKSISKTHAGIQVDASGVTLVDFDSTNGTVIRRGDSEFELEPGTPARVVVGDILVLGKVSIRTFA